MLVKGVGMRDAQILTAEAVGTFILMIGGPGTAIVAADQVGTLGVALAFGLSLLVAAYAVGPVSGCHINPAVTLGFAVLGKLEPAKVPVYWIGQLVGAAAGGALLLLITEVREGPVSDATGILATNQWGVDAGFGGFSAMLIVELVFTAFLIFAVLSTTSRNFATGQVGLTVGMALALIHLATIPIDNTSVNPARSFGVAIFEGGAAIEQLWAFIVFPLLGALIGAITWHMVDSGPRAATPESATG